MLFAKPEEYGLDPTMKRLGSSQQYDVTVQSDTDAPRTYRTLELLAGGDPDLLRGPETRVWKVAEIEDGKETDRIMVLKDSWVAPEQQPEGSIYEQFYRAADIVKRDPTKPSPFLTVECHGDVYLDGHTREVLDCTRHPGPLADQTVKSRNELTVPGATPIVDGTPGASRLVHYRIVFQEVGKSLETETSLPNIFRALSQAVLGTLYHLIIVPV